MTILRPYTRGASRPTPQRAPPLLPWCSQALAGWLNKRGHCVHGIGSCTQLRAGPARPRRPGGTSSGGAQPAARQPRRQAPAAAAAASGQTDGERSDEVVLLDMRLPAAPGAVGLVLFAAAAPSLAASCGVGSSSSDALTSAAPHGLLVHHMQQTLGDFNLAAERWQPSGGAAGLRRQLRYDTPLSRRQRLLLPFGRAAVHNTEEQQVAEEGSGGLRLVSTVSSEGVPFADCFTNRLVWRLLPLGGRGVPEQDGSSGSSSGSSSSAAQPAALTAYSGSSGDIGTRLLLTARCSFHKRVLGPLRGQIEEQSLQASVVHVALVCTSRQREMRRSGGSAVCCRCTDRPAPLETHQSHPLCRACGRPMHSWHH